jgi:hypothetical protein
MVEDLVYSFEEFDESGERLSFSLAANLLEEGYEVENIEYNPEDESVSVSVQDQYADEVDEFVRGLVEDL